MLYLGVSIFSPLTMMTISCAFNFLGNDVKNLSNYDWSAEEPYGSNYQKVNNIANVTNMGSVNIKHNQRYLDYHNFNTGYKNDVGIKKQAVTGILLNSAFLPNGNERRDFGETNKNKMFEPINSILDWNPATDHDAKYNQSDVPLLATKKVAAKWVNSQNSINIVQQFTNKTKNSSDESIKNLQMITYKNDGNLKYLSNGKLLDNEADSLSKVADGRFLQDFYTYPNDSAQWNANHQQYNKFDTYNLYNLGGWVRSQVFTMKREWERVILMS